MTRAYKGGRHTRPQTREQKLMMKEVARNKRDRRKARNILLFWLGGMDSASFCRPSGPGVTYGQKFKAWSKKMFKTKKAAEKMAPRSAVRHGMVGVLR